MTAGNSLPQKFIGVIPLATASVLPFSRNNERRSLGRAEIPVSKYKLSVPLPGADGGVHVFSIEEEAKRHPSSKHESAQKRNRPTARGAPTSQASYWSNDFRQLFSGC